MLINLIRPLKHVEKESKNLAVFEDYLVRKIQNSFVSHSCHAHFKFLASPPECPPPFTAPFEGVKRLTCSPVLHRVIQCVLKQSAVTSENRVWSDKLLHEVLFLCGLMFIEEDPKEPRSLCKAAIGQYGGTYMYMIVLRLSLIWMGL